MDPLDLVVRNGTVVSASDTMVCDVGVRDGRIVALARNLPRAAREIDAKDRFVLPGGIDSHCHIEQQSSFGVMCADDFHSGTVSAAFGGTTTIIPFAAQHRGQSLREVVEDYHARAGPRRWWTTPSTSSSPIRRSRCSARSFPPSSVTATPRSRCT